MLFCTLAAIGADFCYMKMTSDKKHYQLLVNLKLKSIITIPEYDQEDFLEYCIPCEISTKYSKYDAQSQPGAYNTKCSTRVRA